MKAPAFWSRPLGPAAAALWPVSLVYGGVAAARMALGRPVKAAVPVLCVGNVVAGGQGKTPAAMAIAGLLQAAGLGPVFLSRGHGGRLRGPVAVDPARHAAADVGDEPLLLARIAPCVVARDRPAGALLATALGADVVVMDDGFQNPGLAKDLSVIVADAGFGTGNGLCLPAGPLRAPLGGQIARAHALVVIGRGDRAQALAERALRRSIPVFAARLEPEAGARALAGERVLAYAGIGRPQKFFDMLAALGADLAAVRPFPDHHAYDAADVESLLRQAQTLAARLVTTEKDFVRLGGRSQALRDRSAVVPVRLVLERPDDFRLLVLGRLQRRT